MSEPSNPSGHRSQGDASDMASMPLSVELAAGCLLFQGAVLAVIMVVGCVSQGEGAWLILPIACLGWLAYGLRNRWDSVRVLLRILTLLAGLAFSLIWTGVMLIGLSPGPYRFDTLSLVLASSAAIPIASFWVVFFALGRSSASEFCRTRDR